MKIFYMGREINGKFSSFKTKFTRYTKRTVFWSFIALLIYIGFQAGTMNSVSYAKETEVVKVDNLSKKVEELKDAALEALKDCENAHYGESDGIIIFDSNNKASIGEFQFQKDTIIHYMKTLRGQDISRKDAVLIALDTPRAKELAYEIIFTTEKGWTNWITCSEKTGLKETLKIIKKLES